MSEPVVARAGELLEARVRAQGGVPTFFDNYVRSSVRHASGAGDPARVASATEALERFVALVDQDRFQDPLPRLRRSPQEVLTAMAVPWTAFMASQGALQHLTWRGRPLFKTVYDLAAYPMLVQELRPATILELGSGSGASAVWLADVAAPLARPPRVISVDVEAVGVSDPRVEFVRFDLDDVERLLTPAFAADLPHPWLVIEDAHVNLPDVLRAIDALLRPGDYLIVEDSMRKRDALIALLEPGPARYALDRRYTDLCGENTTCAIDSILVRRDVSQ